LSTKVLGPILIVIAIVLFFSFLFSAIELMKAADVECREICGPMMQVDCPHAKGIPLQSYTGFTLTFVLAGIGAFILISGKKFQEELTEKEMKREKMISQLESDERKIYKVIKECGGALFQSELIEKAGFSKVKISRILDKLEGRGLIERRRRGMTNLVLLK